MQTEGFEESLNELIDLVEKNRLAIMCAEALYWRCHRSLIADALLAQMAFSEQASVRPR